MGKVTTGILLLLWVFGAIGTYVAFTVAPIPVLFAIILLLVWSNIAARKENKNKN